MCVDGYRSVTVEPYTIDVGVNVAGRCGRAGTYFWEKLRYVSEDELNYDGLNAHLHEGRCAIEP